jgi:hypothetical protein
MKKLLIIFLLISSPLFSQGPWGSGGNPGGGNGNGNGNGGNNGNGGGRPCWPPPCVPINKGISLLLVSGLVLIIYKIKYHGRTN